MKKIIAFVGETFEMYDGNAYSNPTSVAFLQDCFGRDNVYVCSPKHEVDELRAGYSSSVSAEHFYPSPNYRSTKEFLLKAIFKPGYFREFNAVADTIIAKHAGELFWIRTPSIGSVFFGIRALAAGQVVLHHMCADASNTWRDVKYSFFEKMLGFIVSRYLRRKLRQICRHPGTINLCTGDVLENFSRAIAPNRTYQFVDVMVKPAKIFPPVQREDNRLKVLFVGRVVTDKGVFDLLDVAKKLSQRCRFTIAGGGPELDKAISYSVQLGVRDVVTFTGQLPHSELANLYAHNDVIVVPSNNYYEGFPRVIMEAWSHHKPVVVASVGGIRAFVRHDHNGLIFEPGNKTQLYECLLKLVNDVSVFQRLHIGAIKMAPTSLQSYWLTRVQDILKQHAVNE